MRLTSAAILTNPKKPHARAIKTEMAAFLRLNGVRMRSPKLAQILITIGGDGTILYNKNRYQRPYWAIGSSTSYICQSHQDSWKKDLAPPLSRGFTTDSRLMLRAKLNGHVLPDALNEVVVRSQYHRVLDLELFIGKKKYAFSSDGLIFSTPTGSSAYAYSAGGKEMAQRARRYQIVAIAPYRRLFKPIIVNANVICRVRVVGKVKADAIVDGQMHRPIRGDSELIVCVSPHDMHFVQAARQKKK